jgi:hypothetical protein
MCTFLIRLLLVKEPAALGLLVLLFSWHPLLLAQSQPLGVESPLENRVREGAPGGAGGADFTALMNLIQQTIDPIAWVDGSSVMAPYPAGVSVDPAGQLRQRIPSARLSKSTSLARHQPKSAWPRQSWQASSPLRVVSLRNLDAALGRWDESKLTASEEFARLAGLSKIEYVQVDLVNEDILLAGPALGQTTPLASGFHLLDMALFIELINSRSAPLGCSIDPTDTGILAVQQLLAQPKALKRLAIDPEKFVGQMQAKIGPHHTSVFGLPASSPAAVALLAVDEHMKQVGFGTSQTPIVIESYFDHLDQMADVAPQSLVRWWFAFADAPLHVDQHRLLYELPEQCVALYSEQQWVTHQGRKPSGQRDRAAEAFAAGMTHGLSQLRQVQPAYARLCAIFESALALQLAVDASGQHNLHAWLPNLKRLSAANYGALPEPKTVSGLTAWHKHQRGTVVAVVSGGVQLNPRSLLDRNRWLQTAEHIELPQATSTDVLSDSSWWWDK